VMDSLESQGLPARLEVKNTEKLLIRCFIAVKTEERRAPMDYRAHMDRQGREDRR
jgi:hypothetical protein